jgi:hypothetical protein
LGGPKNHASTPQLESAWFQPLNLKCDILVSKFAFTFNLCRYLPALTALYADLRQFSTIEKVIGAEKLRRCVNLRAVAAAASRSTASRGGGKKGGSIDINNNVDDATAAVGALSLVDSVEERQMAAVEAAVVGLFSSNPVAIQFSHSSLKAPGFIQPLSM